MRFICLHGLGTSNYVLETQFATIRYELDKHFTYDFVEGTEQCAIANEIRDIFSSRDHYYRYFSYNAVSLSTTLQQLGEYVSTEGPFDAVLAFSQGAALAATYLIQLKQQRKPLPFRCAIFFSASRPFDPSALARDLMQPFELGSDAAPLIDIPTAHIWGCNDKDAVDCESLLRMTPTAQAAQFVHSGGHEIPGPRAVDDVQGCVRVIRRAVEKAEREFG